MKPDLHTFKDLCALTLRVWREAAGFFLSIEVCLLLLVAVAPVAGLFLAFMGEWSAVPCFAFALGYLVARPVLHVKGILGWPFI
ncbi:MAG: hypothetical protein V4724_29220 [Pseudomonadota bacterium]